MNTMEKIQEKIKLSSSIAIFSHVAPDGDSIGSSIALYLCLKNMGKKVYNIVDDKIPNIYRFLEGSNQIMLPSSLSNEKPDCYIFLDCADEYRAGESAYEILQKADVTINIDHHISNTHFATLNLVHPEAAATGEIIYNLILELQENISPEIASALYTAISTDTGSFRYDNTKSSTMKIASQLLDYGVDLTKVRINVWESKSFASIQCLNKILPTLKISSTGKVAWIIAYREVIDSMGVDTSELDGMINYPKSISGVEIAIFFKELDTGEIKVGFRSKEFVDVSKLAAFFDGGGHAKAAGCTLKGSIDDVVKKVVAKAEEIYVSATKLR